ncbi:hypothetical protein G6R40_02795 [Chryseobacterium sp. POL2]|uniref:hypothetical protein n=1 Tax=Chryseobacterium sp. POL2 TaxID=2713414 RepID=UPI0013E14756|nr:hypothetical protein [Chryseobacterium sp. POL2]QIG88659.1 hypothetical protein G6R40_02795 [Chryseobacterium sp. POL2]
MSYNGKSIGEVRAFEELKVQERLSVADAFFGLLNYKNNQYGKSNRRINAKNISTCVSPRILPIHC